jgi:hypothetical protein
MYTVGYYAEHNQDSSQKISHYPQILARLKRKNLGVWRVLRLLMKGLPT